MKFKNFFYLLAFFIGVKIWTKVFSLKVILFPILSVKKKIGLIVDDISTLPRKLAKKNEITLVRVKLISKDISQNFSGNIYRLMKRKKINVKTSAPTIGDFLKAYQEKLKKFEKVLVITLSKSLSTTFNSASQAKFFLADPQRVEVIDSEAVVAGEGLFALEALRLVRKNTSLSEVKKKLISKRKNFKTIAFIEDISYAVESGRIPSSLSKIFKLIKFFQIQPLILVGKKIKLKGFKFFSKDSVSTLFSYLKKEKSDKMKLAINYTDNKKRAFLLKEKIEKKLKRKVVFISKLSPLIGLFTGPGALMVGIFKDD